MILRSTSFSFLILTALAGLAVSFLDRTDLVAHNNEETFTTSVKLNSPKKQKDKRSKPPFDEALFDLWIPAEVKEIRGVVVNPYYRKAVSQAHWQAAARQWNFGIIGGDFFGVNSDDFDCLQKALEKFASASGHSELKNACFFFVGMSAGAGMSTRLAELYPDRTIAVAPVCLEVGPRSKRSYQVPMMTIFGEKDGRQMEKLIAKLPETRKLGARWAIAVQWGRKHEFAAANNLAMPFFDQVFKLRYPSSHSPRIGLPKLKSIGINSGICGRFDYWGEHPAPFEIPKVSTENAWLPNRYTAGIWQSFVTKNPKLKIKGVKGVHQKPFEIYSAEKEIEIEVVVVGDKKFKAIELFDGDKWIAKSDKVPAKFNVRFEKGIHAIIAKGQSEFDRFFLSSPSTIIVE